MPDGVHPLSDSNAPLESARRQWAGNGNLIQNPGQNKEVVQGGENPISQLHPCMIIFNRDNLMTIEINTINKENMSTIIHMGVTVI